MDLTARWPLPGHEGLRDRLLASYGDQARGYHDRTHLAEVLAHIDELRDELGDRERVLVDLAAWFHDAVYDGAGEDEERSARLAERELAGVVVDDRVREVARLVRLTASHDPAAGDISGQVLCDADLAILAAGEERYAAYVAGLRRDFAHVDDEAFRTGRGRVLRDLLGRPALFHTVFGRARWEERARANLARELAALS